MFNSNVDVLEKVDSGSQNLKNNDNADKRIENNADSQTNPAQEPRIHSISKSICRKMYIIVREMCFFMLVVVTYATFQNK